MSRAPHPVAACSSGLGLNCGFGLTDSSEGARRRANLAVASSYGLMLCCSNALCHGCAVLAGCRWFGIPSYYVQQMFSQARGTHYLDTNVLTDPSSQVRGSSTDLGLMRNAVGGRHCLSTR